MNVDVLERYLHDHIPISQAMKVRVVGFTEEGLTLSAPLAPNINHQSTMFGGSVSTLAILASWSLVRLKLGEKFPGSRLVVRRQTMEYLAPITSDCVATALNPSRAEWESFVSSVTRKGKGRIVVTAELMEGSLVRGRFEGEFVVLVEAP